MTTREPVLFGQALDIASEKARGHAAELGNEVYLVRDLLGRIRVVLPGTATDLTQERIGVLRRIGESLSQSLGAYGVKPDETILFAGDLLLGEELGEEPDRRLLLEEGGLRLWLLDRQITGQDWMRRPLARQTSTPRVTFYGIKGGVGRSTALAIWAWRLAKKGKRALVLDMDLESPGVSSTLLPLDSMPDFGVVDWLVEDGVGQSESVESEMVAASPLAKDLPGEVRVAPAFGRRTGDYLPKLARSYAEFTTGGSVSWAERVERMVSRLEKTWVPDVVILDSRAGLHDIAAVLVTRMGADALLFAVDSMQTWNAYSFLFESWRGHPQVKDFREKLQIVAGMVPETGREQHLKRFRERSWDLFRERLYDETAGDELAAFSYDLSDAEAPHYPWPVFWHRALQEFDPASAWDEQIAEAALGIFMDEADRLVLPREEEE